MENITDENNQKKFLAKMKIKGSKKKPEVTARYDWRVM